MLGLCRGAVVLVPYRHEWEHLFEEEAKLLRSALGDELVSVEHIGSTSIKRMDAKPILDVMIGMVSMDRANAMFGILSNMGYQHRPNGDLVDRVFFAKGPEHLRTHHLSLTYLNSQFWTEHILFRNALRTNTALAREYAELKRQLARKHGLDRECYTQGKEQFVRNVISMAKRNKVLQTKAGEA